ncbi:RING finger protein 32 [Chlorella vulgaris]
MASLAVSTAALQAHRAAQLQLAAKPATAEVSSLAQRLGLLPSPPPPFSPADWLTVHTRSRQREDSSGNCSICLAPFKAQAQVLLSCSHTFHHACLASFERFSRDHGQARCCPLCRCQAYQKRRIADAELLWRHTCASRIQAAWRGLLARRQFRALRRLLPPQHPTLKRRWCAEQLEEGSSRLVASVERGAGDIDALFAELNATAAAAGAVFSQLSSRRGDVAEPAGGASAAAVQGPAGGEAGSVEAPPHDQICLTVGDQQATMVTEQQHQGLEQQQQQCDWEAIINTSLQRDDQPECAICLAPLQVHNRSDHSSNQAGDALGNSNSRGTATGSQAHKRQRHILRQLQPLQERCVGAGGGLAVLSCSHAFHGGCLSAFEAFAIASETGAPRCPCCRSVYERLDLG